MPPTSNKNNQPSQKDLPDDHAIIMNAPIGIFTTTPDGRYISVNNTLAHMHGYDSPRHLMDSITDIATQIYVDPADRDRLKLMLKKYGKVINFECRLRHRSGRYFWVSENITEIKDEEGKTIGYQGFNQEITQRKRAENALEESEHKYREILSTIEEGYYEINLDGNITFCNEATARMLGHAVNICIGLNYRKICKQPLKVFRAFHTVYKSGQSAKALPVEFIRKDGSTVFGELSITPMKNNEHQIVAFCGVVRDITERKQAEQEREKLQVQLLQAQKMESVGILAGGVAHDFNNLLHVMRGNIEFLSLNMSNDPQSAERLKVVTKSLNRAARLVQQLLLFSRKVESQKMHVDLNQEVESVLRMLEGTIPKMISMDKSLYPAVWPVYADPVQIEQILLNLANNAISAMSNGGMLTIETANVEVDEEFVRLHPGSTAGPHVLLSVTDTGSGMDKEVMEHVFDPFFTTKEVGKGTGLGLASAYGIVKDHGGYIKCYSEASLGTTFKVYLPAGKLDDITVEEPKQPALLQSGHETILVVDDEQDIQDLTREALEMLGYSVKSAASGEEALHAYRNHRDSIDMVLLDLNMPGMGGHKCLQELLRLDPSVKVVIASGYAGNDHGKNVISSGARGFMGKPYQLHEMAAIIRKTLDADSTYR